jgi:hypothetical protein
MDYLQCRQMAQLLFEKSLIESTKASNIAFFQNIVVPPKRLTPQDQIRKIDHEIPPTTKA